MSWRIYELLRVIIVGRPQCKLIIKQWRKGQLEGHAKGSLAVALLEVYQAAIFSVYNTQSCMRILHTEAAFACNAACLLKPRWGKLK